MSTITFDTLKYVRQLEAAGIAPQQAEAFVTAQRDILSEALDTNLATKSDISSLKATTSADIASLRETTSADIASLRADVEKMELRMTIKLGTIVVFAMGAVAAIVKLL